jgi:hypothetical protein
MENATVVLSPWSNFFAMAGTSAASLTGLMFVVITIVGRAGVDTPQSRDGISTYSTPTVTHFALAFFLSAVLAAPWHLIIHPAIVILITGVAALIYLVSVTYRSTRLSAYSPDAEDRLWYTVLPFLAYAAMVASAIILMSKPVSALFVLAGSVILLIFIGIRNAWDVVTYLTIHGPPRA